MQLIRNARKPWQKETKAFKFSRCGRITTQTATAHRNANSLQSTAVRAHDYASALNGTGEYHFRRARFMPIKYLEGDADTPLTWSGVVEEAPATKAVSMPVSGERDVWCEYTPAQMKGKGQAFLAERSATWTFADGSTVRTGLCHKAKLDLPNWARAANMAVRYWRAKNAETLPMGQIDPIAVPEIASGRDDQFADTVDVKKANAHTCEMRREGWTLAKRRASIKINAPAWMNAA